MLASRRITIPAVLVAVTFAAGTPLPSFANAEAPVCALVGPCGDVNASGSVTAADALQVLREAVGIDVGLVCQCAEAPPPVEFDVDEPIVLVSDSYQLTARFTQLADQSQQWAVLSDPAVGSVTADGLYTAGPTPGEDVVEVTSLTDPGVKREQVVRVLDAGNVEVFWSNSNAGGVDNGGTSPKFPALAPVAIHTLNTYHWNYGSGTASVGTLALRRVEDESMYGPWQATGLPGGGYNLYWTVNLGGLVLPAGTYEVLDSDPSTWAQNAGSGGLGMSWLTRWILP